MQTANVRWIVALTLAVAIPVGLALAGLPLQLGAHPWWAVKTALIGAPIGAVAALVLVPVARTWRIGLGLILIALAGYAAWSGKARFAASFAEDALAGRFWYFGWIGVAGGLALAIAAALSPGRR